MTHQSEEIICDCSGTTKEKIQQLINNGKDSFEQIAAATGASTGCGSCDVLIIEILAEKNIDPPTEN
jgi:bacterioferritin-associated ferredoxin